MQPSPQNLSSKTLEQLSMADNPSKPRGEPALVGLSTHTYLPKAFDIKGFEECTSNDFGPECFSKYPLSNQCSRAHH